MLTKISVRGAREHNLKSVDVDIPRDKLVVITGLSGSGKSSLAFDTIYAEGQRRYVESLSAYARQFLELMQKPDADHIEGLSPAISIEQKTTSKNPRSTVGTVTEIYDYMRLLYARVGIPYSPTTGLPITSQTVSQMVDKVMEMAEGTRLYLLAPIVRGRKGEYRKEFMELLKAGFQRVKVDGEFYDIEDVPDLNKKIKHNIEVVVDRLVVRPDLETRLADSIETALQLSDGLVVTEVANDGAIRTLFSAKFACPVSGFTIEEIEPRLFSFNNPFGACPTCDGLGQKLYFDPELVVPDKRLSLNDGALAPWGKSNSPYYSQTLESLGRHFGFKTNTSYEKLPKNIQDVLLYGSGDEEVEIIYKSDNIKSYKIKKIFEGIIGNIKRRWRETDSLTMRDELSKYQSSTTCDACSGHRLKAEALAVKIDGKHISEITELSVRKSYDWFQGLTTKLTDKENEIASRVLKEISERLGFLNNVGLEYLNLSRKSGTLSGGESQRIRLASQIGSGLTGVLYVLDEPSIGLHQRDNSRLLQTLSNLRDMGNSVLVVEHDEEAILSADHVIDMGPGAGIHGGEVVAQGTPKQIMSNKKSLTGKYLSGKLSIPIPAERRKGHFAGKKRKEIVISGASSNNLKNITAKFPLGLMTCVTGVSGSGKSTLTIDTLYKAVARKVNRNRVIPGKHDTITGLEFIDKIVEIDQSPIGRTPRSNPATYTGAFTPIRDWFSSLPESKTRGYKPGRFSFNVKGGRCEACQGDGLIKIEMHFLPDVYVKCDVCDGNRYNRETLEIKFKGKSISDILNMTVEDGVKFFAAIPSVCDKIKMMQKVGLDYIKIGQAATTLSGGEAQRVKLSKELSKRSTGRTLYILDEPTTGLHFEDIKKLLEVIQALVDMGNTVIIIEHNLDVIKTADWVIDIGPEGGSGGGMIIAEGTPEKVARVKDSFTGYYLQKVLKYK
ncbi:MAG: excinuclease ABC subunit UvrA [Emcibacteraceae bacterium]|jgi:excinuclease ABC subunit A|tara:strand:- start:7645 stop:10494 length:2850 start_codon:yes stop_codon:yes gene_type:complete